VVQRVVVDTNVLVSALRSQRGASFALLGHLEKGDFEVAVSVPIVLEYEDALLRQELGRFTTEDIRELIDAICSVAHRQEIFFLWRPLLPDAKDDMVAELAVAAACSVIVTHDVRDFAGVEALGVEVLRPAEFLLRLRGVK